jgi:hypothetical protein
MGWSAPGPTASRDGRSGGMRGGSSAALPQVVVDRGGGGPVESLAAGMPPGEHGLGEPEFGRLFSTLGVVLGTNNCGPGPAARPAGR